MISYRTILIHALGLGLIGATTVGCDDTIVEFVPTLDIRSADGTTLPSTLPVGLGDCVELRAFGQDEAGAGERDVTLQTLWEVTDPVVAEVDLGRRCDGTEGDVARLRGRAQGSVTLEATRGAAFDQLAVRVGTAELIGLSLDPSTIQIAVSELASLRLVGVYSDGSTAPLASSTCTKRFVESGDDPALVNCGPPGVVEVSGLRPGVMPISVGVIGEPEQIQASAAVTVTEVPDPPLRLEVTPDEVLIAPGGTVQLQATAFFEGGRTTDFTTRVRWEAPAGSVVSVNALGTVSGSATGGPVVVEAVYRLDENIRDSAVITVDERRATGLALAPPSQLVAVEEEACFRVERVFNIPPNEDVTNQVSWDAPIPEGLVEPIAGRPGCYRGIELGVATVEASLEGERATGTLSVVSAPPSGCRVIGPSRFLVPDDLFTFTVTGIDALGNDVAWPSQASLRWSVSDSAIMSIDAVTGQAMVQSAGSVTVRAEPTLDGQVLQSCQAQILVAELCGNVNSSFEQGVAPFRANGLWERGRPSNGPITTCFEGSFCMGTDMDGDYQDGTFATLSVRVDLCTPAPGKRIQLEWYQASDYDPAISFGRKDRGLVRYRVGETGEWIDDSVITARNHSWSRGAIDLTSFPGAVVDIEWQHDDQNGARVGNGQGWFIDAVRVIQF